MSGFSKTLQIKDKASLEHWIQLYLQAKLDGKTTQMKMYADIIIKLGGKVPR
jgi:hypothetical protein